ncbi:hypothetical protein [Micromonospora sp. NPDC047074]
MAFRDKEPPGVLEHERAAWARQLLAPERPDPTGWLADRPVGH